MTLEEAQAKITALETTITEKDTKIVGLEDNAKTLVTKEDYDKAIQKADNQGYDRGKTTSDKSKEGFISKEDVDQMLSDRDILSNRKMILSKLGVKSPNKALGFIDNDDLELLGTDGFNEDDFKKKYDEDIVFGNATKQHIPITKNNSTPPKAKLTAETYSDMSPQERSKVSQSDRAALL